MAASVVTGIKARGETLSEVVNKLVATVDWPRSGRSRPFAKRGASSRDGGARRSNRPTSEGPLVDWKAKGHTVELLGNQNVNGRWAYKLKLTLKSGTVRYEYIDVASHFEVRADSTRQVKGHDLQIETTFTDHKKTGGVLFPRKIKIAAAGRAHRARLFVDKVEVHPALSDALFERPPLPKR